MAELNMKQLGSVQTLPRRKELMELQKEYGKLTAERLYKAFERDGLFEDEYLRLQKLFQVDDHAVWYRQEPPTVQAGLSQQPALRLIGRPSAKGCWWICKRLRKSGESVRLACCKTLPR